MKILVLVVGVLALGLASLFVGPVELNLLHLSDVDRLVFWDIRVPRTLAAVFVGASLGLGGALLQTLLRNPLAEPYTLGLSGAASFGAVIAIALGLTPFSVSMPALAALMCLLTALLVLSLSAKKMLSASRVLILTGVMISLFFGSLVILILSLLKPEELQTALFWMMGQIGTERDQSWPTAGVAFLLGISWSLYRHRDLDRLLLGDDLAQSLGTKLRNLRFKVILLVSLLVAICVSISGLIGFIGLLAPHLTKLFLRSHRHRTFLPGSALSGALLLLIGDVAARLISQEREIPTGGLVALLGAPILIYLLQRNSYARD